MRNLVDQLRAFHGQLTGPQRITLYAVAAVALAAVIGVGAWSNQVSWQPLISGASYDEVLQGAAALDEAGVQYKIDSRGQLVVPIDKIGAARSAMAAADVLPSLGDVSELKLGLTPKAQAWAFLRAKEGDLARMVNGIAGVSGSWVHVVPQREALFLGESEPSRASVFLQLNPGTTLESGQVRAIVNLVANAVEGLRADHVSVVDDRGNLLAEGAAKLSGAGSEPLELLEHRRQVEGRYERAVNQALLPILGYDGGFSVTATVDLDPTSTETVSRVLDTDKQAVVSEVFEESESNSAEPGGVPGVDANLPERRGAGTETNSRTARSSSTSNYDYPMDTRTVSRPAGSVERVSVAVQVDAAKLEAAATAASKPPEEIAQQLERAVEAAIGFDEKRNDMVSIQVLPFAETPFVEGAAAGAPMSATMLAAAPHAVAALGLVLLFLYVVRPLIAAATRMPKPEPKADESAGEKEAEPAFDDVALADRLRLIVESGRTVDPADLNRLVNRETPAAAQVLRNWKREA